MDQAPSRVSVIIPVYNHANYIAAALESVLAQSRPAYEIIVVDDGSQDGSPEIAQRYPQVRLFKKPNGGIASARNAGLRSATGDSLAFLDADDFWMPDKLRLQREAFARRPDLDMVFGTVRQFLSPDLTEKERAQRKIEQEILPGRSPGSLLVRRASFDKVGEFHEGLRNAEFVDWYARAKALSLKDEMLPDIVYERRIHAANHGIRERESRVDYFRVLKAAVDRRK